MAKRISIQRSSAAEGQAKTGETKPVSPVARAADTRKLVAIVLLIAVSIACLGFVVLKTHDAGSSKDADMSATSVRKMSSAGVASKP